MCFEFIGEVPLTSLDEHLVVSRTILDFLTFWIRVILRSAVKV